ncbi:hypothetical protein C2E23DRAFT_886853 [Lenzites betulinus]|nr:hypothetical protein C2E23DRAFT_886853 [Lenzites betulinus]
MFDFFNGWDIAAGVMGMGGASLLVYAYHQLPSKKITVLFALLEGTTAFYASCVEQRLLNAHNIFVFTERLKALRDHADQLRVEVNQASNCLQDFANMVNGLTGKINLACYDIKSISVNISEESLLEIQRLETWRRLAAVSNADTPDSPPLPTPDSAVLQVAPSLTGEAIQTGAADATTPNFAFDCQATGENTAMGENTDSSPDNTFQQPLFPATSHDLRPSADDTSSDLEPRSNRAVLRRKQSTPLSRRRAMARAVRRNHKQMSSRSQVSDTINLLDLSVIELAEQSDEEWEDVLSENEIPLVVT